VQQLKHLHIKPLRIGGFSIFVANMLLRVIRNLTLEEVEERIGRFERAFGVTFEKFEELFLKKGLTQSLLPPFSSGLNLLTVIRAIWKRAHWTMLLKP